MYGVSAVDDPLGIGSGDFKQVYSSCVIRRTSESGAQNVKTRSHVFVKIAGLSYRCSRRTKGERICSNGQGLN